MGTFFGNIGHVLGCCTISPSDMDDVEVARGRQSEYTDDVYTDAGKLCVGGESGNEIWVGGLEHVGNLPCNGCTPGVFVSDGDHLRIEGTKEGDRQGGRCGWQW